MNEEQQRKEFEQWLETVKYDNSDILSPSGLAWEAWKAAQKEVTEQRDAVTLRLGNTQERMFNAERQRDRLAEEIRLTLMDNLDLCDGDICTLKRLKDAIGFDLDSQENAEDVATDPAPVKPDQI
jgi:hypothetical protein